MKVSLRWLADYIDLPTTDPTEIGGAFAALGHEVEGIDEIGANWTDVVVAEVTEVHAHPDADKIRLCRVSDGGASINVVCGAWNFEAGAKVAYARPGAVLPGGFEIGVREIRGVESHGMICSEQELRLGDDHAGIIVLEDDAPLGVPLAEWVEVPDVVFDLSITPNRPDAMSMVGLARELGAYFGVPHRTPKPSLAPVPGAPSVGVRIEDPTGCYRFTLRELRRTRLGPSPFWMRRRLRAAGVRPISNVVDVTNYVMLELGHPLHAFDADRVRGDVLVVRRARDGETLVTLDGVQRALGSDDLVICDEAGPTSLAGTMGGAASEVMEDTHRVLLEAASWDPPTIMWMSRRHGLRSEASARFERGVDPNLPVEASARAVQLMVETAGGELLEEVVDEIAVPVAPWSVELSATDVRRVLGPGFEIDEVARLLRSINLDVEQRDDHLQVTVPTFRPDLTRPIDLVEEVARLRGYDWFGETVPTGAAGGWTSEQRRRRSVRELLAGIGLNQALNLSFLGAGDLEAFAYPDDYEARLVIEVTNPLRDEESALRTSLLPGLLRSLRYNLSYGAGSAALFEIGRVFFARPSPEDERIPDQPERLAYAIVGSFGHSGMGEEARHVDLHTASAIWRTLARRLDLDFELESTPAPGFHPGRCAAVMVGGRLIGHLGELHPRTAAAYELPGRVAVAELELSPILEPVPFRKLRVPSTFPPVEFDLAFMVDQAVPAARLVDITVGAAEGLVEQVSVFDEYTGEGLATGTKSLALRYLLRAPDRTLTNEEVAPVRRAMVEAAERELGAQLRGQA